MPLQNRVLPDGEITAAPWRGTLMGNRGILHGDDKRLKTCRWTHPHWVTCVLKFKDWHRPIMTSHHYTELFFPDECVALAAGHRPCGLCRRDDYLRFRTAWGRAHGSHSLDQDDRIIHAARVTRNRKHVRHSAPFNGLPDGTFIRHENSVHLVWQRSLLRFEDGTYSTRLTRPVGGNAIVLTPAPTVATLAKGYTPDLHATALALLASP